MINLTNQQAADFFIKTSDIESNNGALKLDIVLWAYNLNQAERRAEAVARAQQGVLEIFSPRSFIALDSKQVNTKSKNARKKYSVTIVNEKWVREKMS